MIDILYYRQWKYTFLIGIHHQFFLPPSYFIENLPRRDLAFYFPTIKEKNRYLTELCMKCRPQSAAGGIVINEKNQILFIRRNGVWDLPKGKIESNETPEDTAIREVQEETGVSVNQLLSKWSTSVHLYLFEKSKTLIWKETHWYLMKAHSSSYFKPQKEEGVESVEWIPIKDIPELFPIYRLVYDLLLKLIQSKTHLVVPQ